MKALAKRMGRNRPVRPAIGGVPRYLEIEPGVEPGVSVTQVDVSPLAIR